MHRPQKVYVIRGKNLSKIDEASPCRYGAPLVLVVCADKSLSFEKDGHLTYEVNASIVATHMMLEATKMKYNNPNEWNYLKQNYTYARHRYNEIQNKKLDPNISVKDYIDKVHEIRRELLDYELYNGESIKDISLHFYDRVIGNPEENRIGVSIADIKDTLSNMVDTKPRENGSVMIIGKNAKVSYNPKKMRLITPIPGGKK